MKLKLISFLIFLAADQMIQADPMAPMKDISKVPVQATHLGLTVAPPDAGKPITIAVWTISGPRRTLANNITALLEVNLSSDPHFVVVDRTELKKVLDEQALGASGEITPDTAAKIGQLTGAQILVTGREFNQGTDGSSIVLISNVISTANGRVFSQTVEGDTKDLVTFISNVSQKIRQSILDQSSNLLASAPASPEEQLNRVIQKFKGKPHPAVLIEINETLLGDAHPIAQSELERVFQLAGFVIVDNKSPQRPDISITGDAMVSNGAQQGTLFSGQATLEIKARDQATGKILLLDFQQGAAVDISKQIAQEQALKNATDLLAERLLPALAQPGVSSK